MSSSFQETHLLECNRLHSVDYKNNNNDNPAIWQNDLGDGIEIKKGDVINLQSAYIGERGCSTLNAIEFKQTKISDIYHNITYTKIEKSVPQDQNTQIKWRKKWVVDNITEPILQKDNEASIVLGWYKSANLKNTMFLPRNWAFEATPDPLIGSNVDANYTAPDDVIKYGMCFAPDPLTYTTADYHISKSYDFPRPVSDGSRFTCLVRQGTTWWAPDADNTEEFEQDPALADYDYYRTKVDLKIDKGYNGASDVATALTQQLIKTSPETIFSENDPSPAGENNEIEITTFYSTPTYKPFYCASTVFSKAVRTQWQAQTKNLNTCAYNNAYFYIWVKRPDLFLGCRVLNLQGGFQLAETINEDLAGPYTFEPIVLNLEFNEINLQKLKKFFAIQKLYDKDLFLNNNFKFMTYDETINNYSTPWCRFLHINKYQNSDMDQDNILGYDNYSDDATDYPKTTTKCTYPTFFYFDEAYSEIYTNGENIDKLSYGFATKKSVGGTDLIELHPELAPAGETAPGINNNIFVANLLEAGRRIGGDWHFSAYGNIALTGFSGYLETTPTTSHTDETWNVGVMKHNNVFQPDHNYMTHTYIGADQPLIEFEDDHFKMSFLHNTEMTGQDNFDAGGHPKDNTHTVADVSTKASIPIYRINPRVNKVQYTPDAKPYEDAYGTVMKNSAIVLQNENAPLFKVIDSHSGIYIDDWGYEELDFKNGLWGILGFTYDQVNAKLTQDNLRTTRITYDNLYNLKYATTNALIPSDTAKSYNVNAYGAVLYTNQLPTSWVYRTKGPPHEDGKQVAPAIVVAQESIKLIARALPRKMLKPYYTVRNSIIPYLNYIGAKDSNSLLPVLGSVNKINADGDFYFQTASDIEFIATKDMNITSLTTSIHDPDGSYANVALDSCIIIKIIKTVNQSLDIISDIINKK